MEGRPFAFPRVVYPPCFTTGATFNDTETLHMDPPPEHDVSVFAPTGVLHLSPERHRRLRELEGLSIPAGLSLAKREPFSATSLRRPIRRAPGRRQPRGHGHRARASTRAGPDEPSEPEPPHGGGVTDTGCEPRPCKVCGLEFTPRRRSNAQLCGAACKQKAWRDRSRQGAAANGNGHNRLVQFTPEWRAWLRGEIDRRSRLRAAAEERVEVERRELEAVA